MPFPLTLTSPRFYIPYALFAVTLIGGLGVGCSHRTDGRTASVSAPPPSSAQQRIQQIQNDPNQPQALREVRLHSAAETSAPPVRHTPLTSP